MLAVDEKTDEEIIFETEKESILINELAGEIWELLVKYQQRAEYLEAIEKTMPITAIGLTSWC